jgi:SAM-dependent methyltransferase
MWNDIVGFCHRCYHALSARPLVDLSHSPQRALIDKHEFQRRIASLKQHFQDDDAPEVLNDLESRLAIEAREFDWFQRIRIPGTRAYTTSDRARQSISDPGWLNRLGNALSPVEGSILRPLPKWQYIQNALPDLVGKTVMEIGSNNGFFCFKFADLGARHVTGVELGKAYISAAQWMASARGDKNVRFLHTDALLDLSLEPHQVIFMSESYTHFVDPLFGLLRALNLAEETLIIDGPALAYDGSHLNLNLSRDSKTGHPSYIAWTLSDGLLLSFLSICGVDPKRVTRFVSPLRNHRVYVIDTSDVPASRRRNLLAEASFLHTAFRN